MPSILENSQGREKQERIIKFHRSEETMET